MNNTRLIYIIDNSLFLNNIILCTELYWLLIRATSQFDEEIEMMLHRITCRLRDQSLVYCGRLGFALQDQCLLRSPQILISSLAIIKCWAYLDSYYDASDVPNLGFSTEVRVLDGTWCCANQLSDRNSATVWIGTGL